MRGNPYPLWVVGAAVIALAACDRTDRTSNARTDAERDAQAMARAERPIEQRPAQPYDANVGQRNDMAEANQPPDADNTGVNERDRADGAVTPMDQSNESRDLEVTRQIRQAITDSDSLSTDAQNVKVITQGGVVVLRGPVESAQEKAIIVAIASRTAGVSRVDDQLEIAHD